MKTVLYSVTLVAIIIINSGCPKPCIEANYSFVASLQYSPDSDSIKVGDTLFLYSIIPNSLLDQNTRQIVALNNLKIGTSLAISALPEGDTISNGAISSFKFISILGEIYNDPSIPSPDRFQQITFNESPDDSYAIKIGLIPLKTGRYILGIGDALSNNGSGNRGCVKASFAMWVTNTDQHFNLIKKWIPGISLNDYGKKHVYYFKVY